MQSWLPNAVGKRPPKKKCYEIHLKLKLKSREKKGQRGKQKS